MVNSSGATSAGVGTEPKAPSGSAGDVDHEGDAAARPDVDRRAAAGEPGRGALHRAGQPHRVRGDAGAQRPAGAGHEEHGDERGLAVLGDERDGGQEVRREGAARGDEVVVEDVEGVLLAGGRDHEHGHAGAGAALRLEGAEDLERVGDAGAAPAGARLGDAEVAAGGRAVALDADAGRLPAEHLAGLVLGDDAGDVVVDDDDLVDEAAPLAREHADRRRAAADPHPLLGDAVDDGRAAGLRDERRAAVDAELDRLAVAEREEGGAGGAALGLRAAGQVPDAAEREHLRAVFGGGDVADRLAPGAHDGALPGRGGGRCRSSPWRRSS